MYLHRACELAARGVGNTAPNPPVGAVIVRDGVSLGEGYHHRCGEAHAEVEALRVAGDPRGATAYVSLEPCDHHGRTPPCSLALIEAGIARVVIGAHDPNPRTDGAGVARLRDHGIEVAIADDAWAADLIAMFSKSIRAARPFVTLKMASSLDGYIAPSAGQYWLTGMEAREFVRDLRAGHDGVMVGAGTVRVDDPLLTARPPRNRLKPYVRIVACETEPVPKQSRVFEDPGDGAAYARTIVLAPGGSLAGFESLGEVADVIFVGSESHLDLAGALAALAARGLSSVLCEGGPTLAARLLAAGLVDRLLWIVAPRLLSGEQAVNSLARVANLDRSAWRFVSASPLGADLLIELLPQEH